jgi:hypothetical protein
MVDNATPIIDVSKIIKNCASERIDNAFQRLGFGVVVVAVVNEDDDAVLVI